MSMVELVFGAALGFVIAQLALNGVSHVLRWTRTERAGPWLRRIVRLPGPALFGFFVRYAAPIGVSAALLLMGGWAVSDYLKARAAHNAALASTFSPASTTAPEPQESPPSAPVPVRPPPAEAVAQARVEAIDPYADPEFKVQRKARKSLSLKETLLQKSEARARAELLRETQQHLHRSQYDCEAADRAGKYVAAGLDVWGFAAWQTKYFPANNYKGATLPQCRDVSNVVDPS